MTQHDPLEVAVEAAESSGIRFGKVSVEGRFVALVKGQGKVDFDASIHERRNTLIEFSVEPLPDSIFNQLDRREVLAESAVFSKIVMPSLKALGIKKSVGEINDQFVRYELVPTGRTYTNRDGEKREESTFKFTALYDSEETAIAAFRELRGVVHTDEEQAEDDPGAIDMSPVVDNSEKETALQFLAVLVKQHATDDALDAAIKQMPMISKFFSSSSPEVKRMRAA